MKNILSVTFIVSIIFGGASIARAEVVWSCNAMAFEPVGAPTIKRDLHTSQSGRVIFKEGKTGTIVLAAQITKNLGYLRSLRLTYRDGDGKEGPSVVSANIRRVRRSDGHVAALANSTVSSNDSNAANSGPSGWATHQSGAPGNVIQQGMDLDKYYYYVQIALKRTDSAVPLAVMGAYIIN